MIWRGESVMKKFRSLFVVLMIFCLLLVGCTSQNIESETTDVETGETQECKVCQHTFADANCLSPQKCTVCGATVGEALGHAHTTENYVAPTCIQDGSVTISCTICDASKQETLSALGHLEGPGVCLRCGVKVENSVKNLILIIGDGMGKEHIAAGEMVYGENYEFLNWTSTSVNTNCLNASGTALETTDSAASGTALATGTLTKKGYLGKDASGNNVSTILDYAKALGMKTGIVTTDVLTGATPAAFSAHSESRTATSTIIQTQLSSGVDLLFGPYVTDGGGAHIPSNDALNANGYTYVRTLEEANESMEAEKLYGLFTLEGYHSSKSNHLKLNQVAETAIEFLDNEQGFVLIIEQGHIDFHSHDGLADSTNTAFKDMAETVKSLNDTVKMVRNWMGDRNDTAIIITADHETGGLSVSSKNILGKSFRLNSSNPKVYYSFTNSGHTDVDVGLYLYGTSFTFETLPSMKSATIIKNCDVYVMMKRILERGRK